jgi:multidrug efflux pump subunit AcrB
MSEQKQPSYLERIKFDPKLWNSPVAKYITNMRLVLLLLFTVIMVGIISFYNLPQRLNPEIKIPLVIITSVLPGAGPEDVEKLVTIPIETAVRGLSGIDTVTSTSQNNVSVTAVQFVSSIAQEKAKQDVQSAVDGVTGLPTDAQTPKVAALDFENVPVWQFALTTTGDTASLFSYAKTLEDEIKDNPKVDHVVINGYEQPEIAVDVNAEKLATYGISPLLLSQAVKAGTNAYPSGTVETGRNSFALTIDPSIATVEQVRSMRIRVGSAVVKLGDIASVSERSKGNQGSSYISPKGAPLVRAVSFDVYKTTNSDIVQTASEIKKLVLASTEKYNGRFSVVSINNSGELIQEQFTDLLGEFRSTIILVFICLLLFLGLRQAVISSFTVPLTYLSAFFFMRFFGMSINFLSLFAFLLALGLLVDDTIVTVSAMTTYYKTGKFTPQETGLVVWRDTIVPIWSTTITTIWSFIPLLISGGIIGEFIKPIPIVVTVTMISSTAIAVLITLPMMIVILKPQLPRRVVVLLKIVGFLIALGVVFALFKTNTLFPLIVVLYLVFLFVTTRVWRGVYEWLRHLHVSFPYAVKVKELAVGVAQNGIIHVEGFAEWYKKTILKILDSKVARRRVVIAIVGYAVFAFALLPLGLVKNEFFPKTEGELVYVNLEMPAGTTLGQTGQEALRVLDRLNNVNGVEFIAVDVGKGAPSSGFSNATNGQNTALFTYHLPAKKNRKIDSIKISDDLRNKITKLESTGKITISEESSGPPAGADVVMKLTGEDLGVLNTYADKLVNHLEAEAGITNVQKSITPGTSALVFVPDLDKLAAYGFTTQDLGLWLRTYASGFTLDQVNFTNNTTNQKDVVFSFSRNIPAPEDLGRLSIPTAQGTTVPLLSLGTLQTKNNPTVITREGGKRTLSVSAGVQSGFSAPKKNQDLISFVQSIHLPDGYSYSTGGANEENAKSVQSILQSMVIAAILILVTMVIQFQSYRQALIVLLVIPLAVSSVFVVFALTGTPLSFPALIGVLSLFGIVVTNSMFIVDKINLNIKEKMPFAEAIADAGASRMEPIILTKLCTVFGLLPITLSNPLWRGLGGAIISGLLIASTIMLLFIPVVYYSWMKPSDTK